VKLSRRVLYDETTEFAKPFRLKTLPEPRPIPIPELQHFTEWVPPGIEVSIEHHVEYQLARFMLKSEMLRCLICDAGAPSDSLFLEGPYRLAVGIPRRGITAQRADALIDRTVSLLSRYAPAHVCVSVTVTALPLRVWSFAVRTRWALLRLRDRLRQWFVQGTSNS
jgi:hypothetical protein